MQSNRTTIRRTALCRLLPLLLAAPLLAAAPGPARAQLGEADRPQSGKASTPKPKITRPRAKPAPRRPAGPAQKTLVVSARGGAAYRTIGDAILDAPSGAKIVVRPGTYEEGVVIDRGIQLVAEGTTDAVVIESPDKDGVLIETSEPVTIRGFTIRTVAGRSGGKYYGVDIAEGRVTMQDCDVTSDSLACIAIHGRGTNPTIQRCRIRDGAAGGIFIYDGALGLIEDCNISGTALAGIEVKEASNPTVRRTRVHDGEVGGIFVNNRGAGVYEDCDIYRNGLGGVEVKDGSTPTFRRCKMREGKQGGVFIHTNGLGTFEDCDMFGNTLAGMEVKEGGNPTVRNCRLYNGKVGGIFINTQGRGVFESCDVYGNGYAGIEIKDGGNPTIRRTSIRNGQMGGVFVYLNGKGVLEDCDIVENTRAGVEIKQGGNPLFRRCRINRNGYEGIWAYEGGAGNFEYCDLTGNTRGVADISADSQVRRVGCKEA